MPVALRYAAAPAMAARSAGGLLIAPLGEDAAAVEHEPDHADDCEDGEEEQDHDLALLALPGRFVVHLALLAHG